MNDKLRPLKHELRHSYAVTCDVCGAAPKHACIETARETDPLSDPEAQLAWCEFAFMAAVHNLRECKPDHAMVILVETALKTMIDEGERVPEQLELDLVGTPAFLRNQAD